jgi:hypothetical protein
MVVENTSGILLFQVMMDTTNFILMRGIHDISLPPCSPEWEFPRIMACNMADYNYGVCLEISVSFSLNESISACGGMCAVYVVILYIC